jgi:hypothetical protein
MPASVPQRRLELAKQAERLPQCRLIAAGPLHQQRHRRHAGMQRTRSLLAPQRRQKFMQPASLVDIEQAMARQSRAHPVAGLRIGRQERPADVVAGQRVVDLA